MNDWTCNDICEVICEHTDCVSIYICAHNWADKKDGQLVAENIEEEIFLTLFGDIVPDDWHISDGNGWIELGFLFK